MKEEKVNQELPEEGAPKRQRSLVSKIAILVLFPPALLGFGIWMAHAVADMQRQGNGSIFALTARRVISEMEARGYVENVELRGRKDLLSHKKALGFPVGVNSFVSVELYKNREYEVVNLCGKSVEGVHSVPVVLQGRRDPEVSFLPEDLFSKLEAQCRALPVDLFDLL